MKYSYLTLKHLDSILEIEEESNPFPWSAINFRDCIDRGYYSLALEDDNELVGFAIMAISSEESFSVLAFPCNQFGGQEPGSNEEIIEFCKLNYRNTFPVFSKIEVKGNDAHPLFAFLTNERKGILGTEAIKWNFTKFLINREGVPVNRYAPSTTPDKIRSDIEALI